MVGASLHTLSRCIHAHVQAHYENERVWYDELEWFPCGFDGVDGSEMAPWSTSLSCYMLWSCSLYSAVCCQDGDRVWCTFARACTHSVTQQTLLIADMQTMAANAQTQRAMTAEGVHQACKSAKRHAGDREARVHTHTHAHTRKEFIAPLPSEQSLRGVTRPPSGHGFWACWRE